MLTFPFNSFRTTQELTLTTSTRSTFKLMPPNAHKSGSTRQPALTTTSPTRASTTVTTWKLPLTSFSCQAHPKHAGPALTRPEIRKSFRHLQTIRRRCVAVLGQRQPCNRLILRSIRILGSWKITATSNDFLAVLVSIGKRLKCFTKENEIGILWRKRKRWKHVSARPQSCGCVVVSHGVDQEIVLGDLLP